MRSSLAIPTFRRLALGYTLNELGDWLATVTLAILVYDTTSSALATTALFLAAKFLPSLVVPVLAARAEKAAVSRCLLAFYLVEAVLFGLLVLAADDPWVPLICVLAFFDGTIAATGRAISRAATVAVLEPAGRLREGNAALNLGRSEEHTSELQSRQYLVCRLLRQKKKDDATPAARNRRNRRSLCNRCEQNT